MMTYRFLVFALLFLMPGAAVFLIRQDLRRVMGIMALFAIPFAFTEFLFYPRYWEPVFLFDLVNILGFGIEDIIFVVGLASFTSTAYAFVFRKGYEPAPGASIRDALQLGMSFLVVVFAGVLVLVLLSVEMIYGSVLIMLLAYCFIIFRRRDLAIPGILGGAVSLVVYTLLCWAIMVIYPSIFKLTWHTEQFLNIFILGVPLEEIMYAAAAGLIATVFYPFIFRLSFNDLGGRTCGHGVNSQFKV